MSELISGKEALIALANGEDVLYIGKSYEGKPDSSWGYAKEVEVEDFLNDVWSFKLKPRTITINGIEVPAPFEPKEGDAVFVLDNSNRLGFSTFTYNSGFYHVNFGAWRTEEEIKQVVAALRSIFGKK